MQVVSNFCGVDVFTCFEVLLVDFHYSFHFSGLIVPAWSLRTCSQWSPFSRHYVLAKGYVLCAVPFPLDLFPHLGGRQLTLIVLSKKFKFRAIFVARWCDNSAAEVVFLHFTWTLLQSPSCFWVIPDGC